MNNRGFSLVELLVVIVVISLLATLTAFFISDWRTSTAETEVKNDLTHAVNAVENYNNYNSSYPLNQSSFNSLYTNTETVDLSYVRRINGSFCINAQSNVISSVAWYVDSNTGKSPQYGTCS